MNGSTFPLDLLVLVPGKNERETIDGLLAARAASLEMRPVRYQILVHPRRDPGCFHEAVGVVEPFLRRAAHLLVMFDHEGSGQEDRSPEEVSLDLGGRLERAGWGDRAAVIVVVPELDVWVWSTSPHLDEILGWAGRTPSLRAWLEGRELSGRDKPPRPKESLEQALREVRKRRSSAIYREVAEKVSLRSCQDGAFRSLRERLASWFPAQEEGR